MRTTHSYFFFIIIIMYTRVYYGIHVGDFFFLSNFFLVPRTNCYSNASANTYYNNNPKTVYYKHTHTEIRELNILHCYHPRDSICFWRSRCKCVIKANLCKTFYFKQSAQSCRDYITFILKACFEIMKIEIIIDNYC